LVTEDTNIINAHTVNFIGERGNLGRRKVFITRFIVSGSPIVLNAPAFELDKYRGRYTPKKGPRNTLVDNPALSILRNIVFKLSNRRGSFG